MGHRNDVPPEPPTTARVKLEPLHPRHVEADFEALMGSRAHLRRTLGWGDWPRADFTVEENRADLERHWREFESGEAFAYTVLTPDRARCVGCVYLVPKTEEARAARLAFWVVEEELRNDLDGHLVATVLGWIESSWPLDLVAIDHREGDARGAAVLAGAGLEESEDAGRRAFLWRRGRA